MNLKLCLFLMLLLVTSAYGQKQKPKNYSRFDEKTAHFGFMLGFNSADFLVYQNREAYSKYGLISLENISQPGGQLGIVTTLKLGSPVLRLRLIPTLSFQERVLLYTFIDPKDASKTKQEEERIGSTNLDFPLMFQFRTSRFNNFATYVLGGAQYSLDLQSQAEKSQSFIDPFIKIKRDDFQVQAGVGVEFFAPYFKFGMEIKYSQGMINSFIQDNTTASRPIDFLYNKVWWFCLIFEG
ncbi:MAG: PorT family protein [Bacteroidetes bacterium]|nr:PorT family protein [Bacteroidota bacterium]